MDSTLSMILEIIVMIAVYWIIRKVKESGKRRDESDNLKSGNLASINSRMPAIPINQFFDEFDEFDEFEKHGVLGYEEIERASDVRSFLPDEGLRVTSVEEVEASGKSLLSNDTVAKDSDAEDVREHWRHAVVYAEILKPKFE